jgi:hypothetical protein
MKKTKDSLHGAAGMPDIEETGRWLEIAGDTIVGVHNHRCQSELTWVRYEGDDEVRLGYQWKKNKIVKPKVEINDEQLRAAARQHITNAYPTWKQLNLLREGDQRKIEKMSRFIDAIRRWSNHPKADIADLKKIKP